MDHRHETGSVRDVLCSSRDAAPGQFKDRPDAIGGLPHTWKESRGSQHS
ncbi:endonuclease domain-containing protein [Streptomyces griseoflavus]|nr:endonuclease domain-containing protein [Streptomyces griseoflavus]